MTTLMANEGKTFRRIADGEILGEMLTLGVGDRPENYEEVDKLGEGEAYE